MCSSDLFTLNGIPPEQAKKRLLDEQIPLDQPILAVSMRQSAHIAGRLDELAAFCDKAAQTHTVLFIIMQTPDDRAVTEDIRARMTARSYTFASPGEPETMMGVIALCDAVFSMRLHTVIFAAKERVPVMGLVYDPKVQSYLELLGMPSCGTPADFSAETGQTVLTGLLQNRAEYAARLSELAPRLEAAAGENEQVLAQLLGLTEQEQI